MQRQMDADEVLLVVRSRHFDYRGTLRFSGMEAPPNEPAIRMTLEALGPLFQAYAAMPFSSAVTRPLLQATMDHLLAELYRHIRRTLHPLVLRPRISRLVPDRNPPVQNFWLQANNSRIHMDRIEAAFEQVLERGDGSLVSLDRGEVVPPRREPEIFLDPEDFLGRPRRGGRAIQLTATEERIRRELAAATYAAPTHTHDTHNYAQIFRQHVRDVEAAIFFGVGPRVWDFDDEAIERSKETLLHCLNDVQRAEFLRSGSFSVVGQDGRLYRVLRREAYNVEDDLYEYCCVPAAPCPIYDKMLASKLWLEAQLRDFMNTANRHYKRGMEPRSRHAPRMFFDFLARNPRAGGRLIGA